MDAGTPLDPEGPLALPGKYTATLTVNGRKYTQPFTVKEDPRVHVSMGELQKQLNLAKLIDKALKQAVTAHGEIERMLNENKGILPPPSTDSLMSLQRTGNPSFASVAGNLASLAPAVQGADAAPTQGELEVYALSRRQLDDLLARWHKAEAAISKSGK